MSVQNFKLFALICLCIVIKNLMKFYFWLYVFPFGNIAQEIVFNTNNSLFLGSIIFLKTITIRILIMVIIIIIIIINIMMMMMIIIIIIIIITVIIRTIVIIIIIIIIIIR